MHHIASWRALKMNKHKIPCSTFQLKSCIKRCWDVFDLFTWLMKKLSSIYQLLLNQKTVYYRSIQIISVCDLSCSTTLSENMLVFSLLLNIRGLWRCDEKSLKKSRWKRKKNNSTFFCGRKLTMIRWNWKHQKIK